MIDPIAAYHDARHRIADLVTGAPDPVVPACPKWQVRDLVAHLTGLAGDWVAGNLGGYAGGAWTGAQVEARRDMSLADLLEEWEGHAVAVEAVMRDPAGSGLPDPLLTDFGPVPAVAWPAMIVTDVAQHEQDLRAALDQSGARTSDAIVIGLSSQIGVLRFVARAMGLPVLSIEPTDLDRTWPVGRGDPEVILRASAFELFRATGGRRSQAQIDALDWSGAADAWRHNLVHGAYQVPSEGLVE
jgi:uncharacterized protein (TIGR03083 family)